MTSSSLLRVLPSRRHGVARHGVNCAATLCSGLLAPATLHHPLSSGVDLRAALSLILEKGQRILVSIGLSITLPPSYEAQICPRLGLVHGSGITPLNSSGTKGADYRGELKVLLINLSDEAVPFRRGESYCTDGHCARNKDYLGRNRSLI